MCGRVACTLAPQTLLDETCAEKWSALADATSYQSFNAGPTCNLPVLVANCSLSDVPMLKLMKWGLIPSYSKTGKMENSTFNARSETVTCKSMFKRLVNRRRCVAVVDGYYEWQNNGMCKQPYFVSSHNSNVLYMAGLFDCWENKLEGNQTFSFTVLTMDSGEDLSWLHHRKPVILDSEAKLRSWLAPESEFDFNTFMLSLGEDAKPLRTTKVSALVNSVKNNSPNCKKPLAEVQKEGISKFLVPRSSLPTPTQKTVQTKQTTKVKKEPTTNQPTLSAFWKQ